MRRMRTVLLALVIGLLPTIGLLLPTTAQTAGIVVGEDGYACDYAGLAAAIDTIDDGGTVTFNCTATTVDFTETTGNITITKTVTIDGSNGGDSMIFDGNQQTNMFVVTEGGQLTVQQLTFQNGNAPLDEIARNEGGAIDGDGGDIIVLDSDFTNNTAEDVGGAIDNDDGTLTITQSSFTDNTAGDGGAIFNDGNATITQSSFTNNTAELFGGAIGNDDGMLTISQSSFTGNEAEHEGGAIFNDGNAMIGQSSFTDNESAANGGAIFNFLSVTVDRSSFVSNHADGHGGGIYALSAPFTLTNSTLTGNTSDNPGSAVYIDNYSGSTSIRWSTIAQPAQTSPALAVGAFGTVELEGVILAGPGNNCASSLANDSSTLADDDSCGLQGDGSLVVDDAGLPDTPATRVVNGITQTYYPLLASSPAVDAGGAACPATDQLGNQRPFGNACNIGAIELFVDPVDLCTNRWTGDLRMPRYGRCATTETMLHLPADGPLTLCANRWTGDARYSAYDRCRSTETAYIAAGMDTIDVCINRWTGELRVSERCYRTEWSDLI